MTFPTSTLSALLLAATASLGLLHSAAQARNGENTALIAGALLGLAAGTTLARSGDEGYDPPPPRPVPPRFAEPVEDEYAPSRPFYGPPRYHSDGEGWHRGYARFRAYDERPCPDRIREDAYDAYR